MQRTLRYSQNKITSAGASIIADALNNNIALQNLYVGGNLLCNSGIQSLAKTLSLNNSKLSTFQSSRALL